MYKFDLDAYLSRIDYAGPLTPSADVLFELHRLHPGRIVFEGLDVLVGRGVELHPATVDAKLIGGRRGGYCFEQNSLFKRALETLGFRVNALLARSRWNRPQDEIGPRTHMALAVQLGDQHWLADVGFGGCVMTAPIRLGVGEVQSAGFEPIRVESSPGGFQLQVRRAEGWKPVYDIELDPQHDSDFLTPNWWTSTHPTSFFRNHLMVTSTQADVRRTLVDNRLITLPRGGAASWQDLAADDVCAALTGLFALPWEPRWTKMAEEAVASGDKRQKDASASLAPVMLR